MTHIFGEGGPEGRVHPFPAGHAQQKPTPIRPAAVSLTIVGQAALDAYRFYLGRGATADAVLSALDTTVRSIELSTEAALEVTSRTWDLLGLPLLTVGLATPQPRPHPPRCG